MSTLSAEHIIDNEKNNALAGTMIVVTPTLHKDKFQYLAVSVQVVDIHIPITYTFQTVSLLEKTPR